MLDGLHQGTSRTSAQITSANIIRALGGGFALVILLLLAAGYVGIRSIESIRGSVASLVQEQSVTARLIEEIQDEQAALSAVFYKLAGDPATVDRKAILSDLDQADQRIDRTIAEVAGTSDEPQWRELQRSSQAFADEARRLLGQEDATTFLSLDLFHRHDQVISIVAKLVAAANRTEMDTQTQIRSRSDELLIRTSILLGSCLLLALFGAVLTVRTITRLFAQMESQATELSRVSWRMVQTQESAARRFSHELHDEMGQCLAALKANLAVLTPGNPSDANRLSDSVELVDEAIRNVRELSQLLRPTILDDFGLDASLRSLSERFQQRMGIPVNYESNFKGRLPEQTETHLYRIAQEALTNVARHAKAGHIGIRLQDSGQRLVLTIRDDGRGLAPAAEGRHEGLGLTGMEARARSAGGRMRLQSSDGTGVLIEIEIPLQQQEGEVEREKDPHFVGG